MKCKYSLLSIESCLPCLEEPVSCLIKMNFRLPRPRLKVHRNNDISIQNFHHSYSIFTSHRDLYETSRALQTW